MDGNNSSALQKTAKPEEDSTQSPFPELKGYLKKKSRQARWQKRWFEANDHYLTYMRVGAYNISVCNATAWTYRELSFEAAPVLSATGFTQVVSNVNIAPNTADHVWPPVLPRSPACPVILQGPNGPPAPGAPSGSGFLGTGHGGERVSTLLLQVGDGPTYDLLNEDHAASMPAAGLMLPAGQGLRITKTSQVGAFTAEQALSLHPTHGLQLEANLTRIYKSPQPAVASNTTGLVNFLYSAMTMFALPFRRWVAKAANGSLCAGQFAADNSFSLQADIRWAAVFDDVSLGALYQYPADALPPVGSGAFKNSFWNRRYDHKLYLRQDPPAAIGDMLQLRHSVRAFRATNATWVAVAEALAQQAQQ
eukprot:g3498.t1